MDVSVGTRHLPDGNLFSTFIPVVFLSNGPHLLQREAYVMSTGGYIYWWGMRIQI